MTPRSATLSRKIVAYAIQLELRDVDAQVRPSGDTRNVEYSVGSSSTRTASPEYGRQRKMPARNRRYAASSTSAVMSGAGI